MDNFTQRKTKRIVLRQVPADLKQNMYFWFVCVFFPFSGVKWGKIDLNFQLTSISLMFKKKTIHLFSQVKA